MGFILNPIAGMGGAVGLKGTDGEAYSLAVERGAKPVSPSRALLFLNNIDIEDFKIYAADKPMGRDVVERSRHRDKLVKIYPVKNTPTTRQDTIEIAREMVRDDVDIIVFVGGDGTARDIYSAVDQEKPVLGIPSGVKIYSAVFAVNPRAAAIVFREFVKGNTSIVEREVLDIDEEAFRRNVLNIKLYGYLKVPVIKEYIQSMKSPSPLTGSEEENKNAIARYVVEEIMDNDTLYLLGPGSTVKAINKVLKQPYTLLGVDALYNYKVIGLDLWEKQILELINKYGDTKIIVTPIGGQGFIFGRGNQQFTPKILRLVGRENIIIIATWDKIRGLDVLRIDTGDPDLDKILSGYYKVVVDYNRYVVKKAVA